MSGPAEIDFPDRHELEVRLEPYLVKSPVHWTTVSRNGVRSLAQELHLPERSVMIGMLQRDLWPERFSRCRGALSADALTRLLSSRIVVAGCGGLGGHVAALLTRMGAGSLVLCDPDCFEESNLNRQNFCTEKTLGQPKAEVCRDALLDMASYMDVEAHVTTLDENTLPPLLQGADAVMDCLDSIARKKMLERAANIAGIPCVQGAVARNEGLCLCSKGAVLPFSRVYPGEAAGNKEGAPMNTHVLTVTGTACLMAALLVRLICMNRNDRGKLYHLDLAVPELETLIFDSGPESSTTSF